MLVNDRVLSSWLVIAEIAGFLMRYSDVDNGVYCVCTHDVSLCMYARFFALYALKIQTCAYHVHSKNQRYANSFRFDVYSDKNTFKIVTK